MVRMSARVASLSDNVFGVAMTLLAVDIFPASLAAESATWTDLRANVLPRFLMMVLSFTIAGTYWLSHHQRLAMWDFGRPVAVYANLLFLLAIVLLPVTSRFNGDSATLPVRMLFGADLAAIAGLNAALWLIATQGLPWMQRRHLVGPAGLVAGWFLAALAMLVVRPGVVGIMWYCAFLLSAIALRVFGRAAAPPG